MARNYNGSSNAINVAANASINPTTTITLSLWFEITNFPAMGGYTSLISCNNGAGGEAYSMSFPAGANTKIAYYFHNNTVHIDPGTNLVTGGWHHVAATYNSTGNLIGYLDGAVDGSVAANGALAYSGTDPTEIGPLGFWNLEDAAIWNVDLGQNEITALAKGARPYQIRPSSLVAFLPLDGIQSPEPDFSGNKNNGVLTNTTRANSVPPISMFTPQAISAPQPPSAFFLPPMNQATIIRTGNRMVGY